MASQAEKGSSHSERPLWCQPVAGTYLLTVWEQVQDWEETESVILRNLAMFWQENGSSFLWFFFLLFILKDLLHVHSLFQLSLLCVWKYWVLSNKPWLSAVSGVGTVLSTHRIKVNKTWASFRDVRNWSRAINNPCCSWTSLWFLWSQDALQQ